MPIFSPAPDPLFTQRSLATLLKDQIHKMENTIDELSDDVFLQNSADDMIEAISQDAYLPPIELHADKGISHPPIEVSNIIVNQSGVPINGFRYSIEVPYTGASGLFNHQPETHDLEKPTAQLNSHSLQGSIIINRIATAEVTPEELAAAFDAELDKVGRYIGYTSTTCDGDIQPIAKNHFSLVKPESRRDPVYIWARSRIDDAAKSLKESHAVFYTIEGANGTELKSTICEALDLVLGPDRLSRFPAVEEFDFYNAEYLDVEGTPRPLRIEVLLTELSAEVENACGSHLEFWYEAERRILQRGEIELANTGGSLSCSPRS
jgi:hypothetical protein